jgi:Lipopolysaccharide kinase (Kdo/WaaP) family
MGVNVVWCRPEWVRFAGADWLDHIMTVPTPDRFHAKQGRSIGRWTLTDPDGNKLVVYLKRHFELPRRHALGARFFPKQPWSPGMQEFDHLRWVEEQGLPVPRVWAAGELRGAKLQSFLVLEELAGMLPLHEAVPLAFERLDPASFDAWKRGLIGEMARLTRELHRRRRFHNDLYLCHFYIAEADTAVSPDGWCGRVVMIDFHRLEERRIGWQWGVIKDVAQLLYSSAVPGVTPADHAEFWTQYRNGDWGDVTPPSGWFCRPIRFKAARYQRHHDRKAARRNLVPIAAPPHP